MSSPPNLSPTQRAALLSAPASARFKHFIGRAADSESVWSLRNASGWVALADETGAAGFPVWPHPDYAAACATGLWTGCAPAQIEVHEFTEKWLSDMTERGVSVAVFPTPSMKGVWINPQQLERYLTEELGRYG